MWRTRVNFEPVTNREDITLSFRLPEKSADAWRDLSGMSAVFELRPYAGSSPNIQDDGYAPLYDVGAYGSQTPSLRLTTSDGIALAADGTVTITIPLARARTLSPGTYRAAMTLTSADGSTTEQVFLGYLPVLFGGVE